MASFVIDQPARNWHTASGCDNQRPTSFHSYYRDLYRKSATRFFSHGIACFTRTFK